MREDYNNDYTYLYNLSVLHDENDNNHVVDRKFAHDLAKAYARYKFKDDIARMNVFMDGWYDFYYHMFD